MIADALALDGEVRTAFERSARGHILDLPTGSTRVGGLSKATRALPRDVQSFTGREPELLRLTGMARDIASSDGIRAIGGMAGIGKTALAVHAAHLLAKEFPDGQIFLSLNAHTPGLPPVESSDALESLLLLTDIRRIPAGTEARAALWRKYLAGKKMLLVLDDAASSDQVLPLLPGTPGSLVLITSRKRLKALQDAAVLSLDVLPAREAGDMLIRLAGRPDLGPAHPAVADITRLCGYLPLAIGLAAAQLRHDLPLSPGMIAARLADEQHRSELMQAENISVSSAFDMSYQDLDPARQRLFRRLALQPGGDIDMYAAAALDDSGTSAAQRGLDVLYDHYLIAQPGAGRYIFHDLIREHARGLIAGDPAAERDGALTRLLDYYLITTRAADRHLERRNATGVPAAITVPPVHAPELRSREEALAWMDAHSVNLRAAVSLAVNNGKIAHAIAIPAAMAGYLQTRNRWAEGITLYLTALAAADEAGDQAAAVSTLTDLGRARLNTGEVAAAGRNLTRAVAIARALGSKVGEANALNALGAVQHSSGDFKSAARSLRRALRLYRESADPASAARARFDLGVIQYNTGEYPAAVTNFRTALRTFRNFGNRLGQADAFSYLAAVDRETGDYTSAAANMTTAVGIYRDLDDPHEEAGALLFLGGTQHPVGKYPEALRNLTAALEIYHRLREPFGEAATLSELGFVQWLTEDPAAATSLERALELFRGLNSRIGEAEVLSNLGRVQCQAGDYPAATVSLERALELHQGMPNPNGEANTLSSLGELMLATDRGHARRYFDEALDIAVSASLLPEEARAREGIGMCVRETGEGEAELRKAQEIYQRMGSPSANRVAALLAPTPHHEPPAAT